MSKKQRINVGDRVTHIYDHNVRGTVEDEEKSGLVFVKFDETPSARPMSRDELLTRRDLEERRAPKVKNTHNQED
jgi:hypothetical protein